MPQLTRALATASMAYLASADFPYSLTSDETGIEIKLENVPTEYCPAEKKQVCDPPAEEWNWDLCDCMESFWCEIACMDGSIHPAFGCSCVDNEKINLLYPAYRA